MFDQSTFIVMVFVITVRDYQKVPYKQAGSDDILIIADIGIKFLIDAL